MVGVEQEHRDVDLGQHVSLVGVGGQYIARKPLGWNDRTLSRNGATRSTSADGENIDGAIAATNSSGVSRDASSDRASL